MDVRNLLSDAKPLHQTRRAQQTDEVAQTPDNQATMERPDNGIWRNIADLNPQQNAPQIVAAGPQRLLPARHVTFELLLTDGTYHSLGPTST